MPARRAPTATIITLVLIGVAPTLSAAQPVGCLPPVPPFLPSDPADVRAYADLLRADFEAYIHDFQAYMACLDGERARAFQEGQAVTQDYGRLLEIVQAAGSPAGGDK